MKVEMEHVEISDSLLCQGVDHVPDTTVRCFVTCVCHSLI